MPTEKDRTADDVFPQFSHLRSRYALCDEFQREIHNHRKTREAWDRQQRQHSDLVGQLHRKVDSLSCGIDALAQRLSAAKAQIEALEWQLSEEKSHGPKKKA